MKKINPVFFIILVVLFLLGVVSLFFSIRHLYTKEKPSSSVSEQPVDTKKLSEPQVSPMESNAPPVDERSRKLIPKEVNSVKIQKQQEKVASTLESSKADEKVDSSEEPSDISTFQLNDLLELEKKRAAIIKQLIPEKSKTPKTVPSLPEQGKTWSDVSKQLKLNDVLELEKKRAAIIKQLIPEKSKTPKTVPSLPEQGKTWSDVSKQLKLNNVLELEKKRAAIIKKLILENSKPPKTVPLNPDQRKTWAEVADKLRKLEQQREDSINSLSTPAANNQQNGK
jgi:hypothetical protein